MNVRSWRNADIDWMHIGLVGVHNQCDSLDLLHCWDDDFRVAADGTCLNALLFGVSAYCLQRFEIWQSQIGKRDGEVESR